MATQTKTCTRCRATLPAETFSPTQAKCRPCRAHEARARRDGKQPKQHMGRLNRDRALMRKWSRRIAEETEKLAQAEAIDALTGEYLLHRPDLRWEQHRRVQVRVSYRTFKWMRPADAARWRIEYFKTRQAGMLTKYGGEMETREEAKAGTKFDYSYRKPEPREYRWMDVSERLIAEANAEHERRMAEDPEYREEIEAQEARAAESRRWVEEQLQLVARPPIPPAAEFDITPRTPRVRLWHGWMDTYAAAPYRDPETQQREIEQDQLAAEDRESLWAIRRPLLEALVEATDREDAEAIAEIEAELAENTFTYLPTRKSA